VLGHIEAQYPAQRQPLLGGITVLELPQPLRPAAGLSAPWLGGPWVEDSEQARRPLGIPAQGPSLGQADAPVLPPPWRSRSAASDSSRDWDNPWYYRGW
jgi:hypothetical protein